MAIWRRLLLQLALLAASRTFWIAGSSMAMRIAIIAITTSSSMSVNARRRLLNENIALPPDIWDRKKKKAEKWVGLDRNFRRGLRLSAIGFRLSTSDLGANGRTADSRMPIAECRLAVQNLAAANAKNSPYTSSPLRSKGMSSDALDS